MSLSCHSIARSLSNAHNSTAHRAPYAPRHPRVYTRIRLVPSPLSFASPPGPRPSRALAPARSSAAPCPCPGILGFWDSGILPRSGDLHTRACAIGFLPFWAGNAVGRCRVLLNWCVRVCTPRPPGGVHVAAPRWPPIWRDDVRGGLRARACAEGRRRRRARCAFYRCIHPMLRRSSSPSPDACLPLLTGWRAQRAPAPSSSHLMFIWCVPRQHHSPLYSATDAPRWPPQRAMHHAAAAHRLVHSPSEGDALSQVCTSEGRLSRLQHASMGLPAADSS